MSNSASTNRRRLTVAIAATSSLACLSIAGYASASAPPGSEPPASEPEGTATASSGDFDLDALIAGISQSGTSLETYVFDNVDLPGMVNYIATTCISRIRR